MRLIALVLLALDFSPILASDTDAALALATARRSRIAAAQQAPQTVPATAPTTYYLVNGQWVPEAQFQQYSRVPPSAFNAPAHYPFGSPGQDGTGGNPFGVTGNEFGAAGGSCANGQCSPATSYQRRGFFRR